MPLYITSAGEVSWNFRMTRSGEGVCTGRRAFCPTQPYSQVSFTGVVREQEEEWCCAAGSYSTRLKIMRDWLKFMQECGCITVRKHTIR